MSKKIMTFVKRPGKDWAVELMPATLEAMQAAVGGYIEQIAIAKSRRCRTVLLFDEDGRRKALAPSCGICGMQLVGTVIVAGVKETPNGGVWCDVPMSFDGFIKQYFGGC